MSRSPSRSISRDKVHFTYSSPAKNIVNSIMIGQESPNRNNSPYRLLASSRKSEVVPEIRVSSPPRLKKNDISSYSFGEKEINRQGIRSVRVDRE